MSECETKDKALRALNNLEFGNRIRDCTIQQCPKDNHIYHKHFCDKGCCEWLECEICNDKIWIRIGR